MRWGDRRVMSWPSKCTEPALRGTSPDAARASVLLPGPVHAQHGDHRSRLDRDRHAEECLGRSVEDVQVAHVEEEFRHDVAFGPRSSWVSPR